ncbi:hypothetical protein C8Q75DRAFT_729750 [Abortiporus biennis]|nr:hypothetical protein C8Q75DRAFT_729750 [Abortiporus biennis]
MSRIIPLPSLSTTEGCNDPVIMNKHSSTTSEKTVVETEIHCLGMKVSVGDKGEKQEIYTPTIRVEGNTIQPLGITRPATYAEATNLALTYPSIASQILALPLSPPPTPTALAPSPPYSTIPIPIPSPSPRSHIANAEPKNAHTSTAPNWAMAPDTDEHVDRRMNNSKVGSKGQKGRINGKQKAGSFQSDKTSGKTPQRETKETIPDHVVNHIFVLEANSPAKLPQIDYVQPSPPAIVQPPQPESDMSTRTPASIDLQQVDALIDALQRARMGGNPDDLSGAGVMSLIHGDGGAPTVTRKEDASMNFQEEASIIKTRSNGSAPSVQDEPQEPKKSGPPGLTDEEKFHLFWSNRSIGVDGNANEKGAPGLGQVAPLQIIAKEMGPENQGQETVNINAIAENRMVNPGNMVEPVMNHAKGTYPGLPVGCSPSVPTKEVPKKKHFGGYTGRVDQIAKVEKDKETSTLEWRRAPKDVWEDRAERHRTSSGGQSGSTCGHKPWRGALARRSSIQMFRREGLGSPGAVFKG